MGQRGEGGVSVDDVDPLAAEDVAEVGHGAHDGREARLVVEGDQGEVVDLERWMIRVF